MASETICMNESYCMLILLQTIMGISTIHWLFSGQGGFCVPPVLIPVMILCYAWSYTPCYIMIPNKYRW